MALGEDLAGLGRIVHPAVGDHRQATYLPRKLGQRQARGDLGVSCQSLPSLAMWR